MWALGLGFRAPKGLGFRAPKGLGFRAPKGLGFSWASSLGPRVYCCKGSLRKRKDDETDQLKKVGSFLRWDPVADNITTRHHY